MCIYTWIVQTQYERIWCIPNSSLFQFYISATSPTLKIPTYFGKFTPSPETQPTPELGHGNGAGRSIRLTKCMVIYTSSIEQILYLIPVTKSLVGWVRIGGMEKYSVIFREYVRRHETRIPDITNQDSMESIRAVVFFVAQPCPRGTYSSGMLAWYFWQYDWMDGTQRLCKPTKTSIVPEYYGPIISHVRIGPRVLILEVYNNHNGSIT